MAKDLNKDVTNWIKTVYKLRNLANNPEFGYEGIIGEALFVAVENLEGLVGELRTHNPHCGTMEIAGMCLATTRSEYAQYFAELEKTA